MLPSLLLTRIPVSQSTPTPITPPTHHILSPPLLPARHPTSEKQVLTKQNFKCKILPDPLLSCSRNLDPTPTTPSLRKQLLNIICQLVQTNVFPSNIVINIFMFSNRPMDLGGPKAEISITVNAVELVFVVLFMFEVGFLVGKQWQLKEIVKNLMNRNYKSLPPSADTHSQKRTLIPQDSHAPQCLALAHERQNLDPQNVESHLFQEKLPFQAPKRNTRANFQLVLERKGSSLLKVEKYEQVTEFESSSTLATYEFNKLLQTMKSMSENETESDKTGIEVKLNRANTSTKTEVLIKRLSFKEVEKNHIEVEGICENGKFKALFGDIKKIGEGGFGSVYEATSKAQNKQYAIKKIYLKDLKGKDFLREVTIVNHLTHANIVRYYTWWIEEVPDFQRKDVQIIYGIPAPTVGIKRAISFSNIPVDTSESSNGIYFERQSGEQQPQISNHKVHQIAPMNKDNAKLYSLYIQMELYKDGTLQEYLRNKERKVKPEIAFSIVKEMFNGLNFLHSQSVVHRDLKPANIFLDHKEKIIKIGDFGLSVLVGSEVSVGEYFLSNKLGTPCYMAPEIKESSRISRPDLLDVYSLGVIYYQLLKKFSSEHERVTKLKEIGNGCVDLEEFPLERELIRMMTRNQKTRLSIDKLKESKVFQELSKKYGQASWIDRAQAPISHT